MADNLVNKDANDCFKETVCIDALRVYDSCSDKDCIEDTRVYFTQANQQLIDAATSVRIRDVSVIYTYIDLQPIPFNRGFYSVDITFYFDVSLELFTAPATAPNIVNGVSVFNKKVILYGSDGSVKVFSSGDTSGSLNLNGSSAVPKAVVQVAEPIALSAKLIDSNRNFGTESGFVLPENVAEYFGGNLEFGETVNSVYVTLGLFIIVQIVRNTQMLIPAYDFCIPDKECVTSSDNPCELFRQIDFPINEFFPPKIETRCNND